MSQDQGEKSKSTISEEAYKEIVTNELERIGIGGKFVWSIFFLCVLPNILNGFHVNSYTMIGHLPDDQWCSIEDLKTTNWTVDQIRSISQKDLNTKGCTVWDWDYGHLSKMTYDEAYNYTSGMSEISLPAEVSCKAKGGYNYTSPESTFVADWDLVCERAVERTSAQVVIALGKFFGSFSFGIFSDKFGRKSSFTLGATFFVVSSFFCTFSPWYFLFLIGRFGLGSASSGLFYPAFAMIVENICIKHRSWMSIAFSASYPIGMIILAVAAYLVEPWRYLQLTLTIPALLLILNCYLMDESPRWLIANKRYDRAYRILFKQKSHYEIVKTAIESPITSDKKIEEPVMSIPLWQKIKDGPLKQIISLFATSKVRKLILTSYFMFCVTSLCYYVTALNASNLAVSRFLYVGITGLVDLPSYLVPVVMLRLTGRRITTMSLFFLTGIALLLVLVVPEDKPIWIVSFAMLGRFGISATYSVVTLYTAELYPTEIRSSALGTCSTWAHVGSITAPYAVDLLGPLGWYIPTTICGCCVLVAGILTLTLPETGTGKLVDRVTEVSSESKEQQNKENVTSLPEEEQIKK
ncbi:organic cation transporter protein [Calliphora vicina]|uniref:organic cation transporter protein n=1 Tax=Calliphora vicina TaxID=7373 RepID=UPI00325A8615